MATAAQRRLFKNVPPDHEPEVITTIKNRQSEPPALSPAVAAETRKGRLKRNLVNRRRQQLLNEPTTRLSQRKRKEQEEEADELRRSRR
jgi:hypothetical protein